MEINGWRKTCFGDLEPFWPRMHSVKKRVKETVRKLYLQHESTAWNNDYQLQPFWLRVNMITNLAKNKHKHDAFKVIWKIRMSSAEIISDDDPTTPFVLRILPTMCLSTVTTTIIPFQMNTCHLTRNHGSESIILHTHRLWQFSVGCLPRVVWDSRLCAPAVAINTMSARTQWETCQVAEKVINDLIIITFMKSRVFNWAGIFVCMCDTGVVQWKPTLFPTVSACLGVPITCRTSLLWHECILDYIGSQMRPIRMPSWNIILALGGRQQDR